MRFRIFPLVLIALGAVLLLGNLGIVSKESLHLFFHTWWPGLLVALGVAMLLCPRCRHRSCGAGREDGPNVST